ncbi:WD40-repeat-containing domain protein [Irpex lacteus]|nr:WD40-repeat-containing domain protein [Irpex lacteus]
MSNSNEDEVQPPQKPPSPPPHTTFAARGIHPPNFSAFKPRDIRIPSHQGMTSIAWNCDGKRLGAVGIDKVVRIWWPDKSVDVRSASTYTGGHTDDVDHLSWNPTHPDLFCTSSQKDKRIVFWDARQSRYIQTLHLKHSPSHTVWSPTGKDLVCITTSRNLLFAKYGPTPEGPGQSWHAVDREGETEWYLATGGNDSIVNLFDTNEWLCARTITACDHAVNALSFSHDGEFLAIASSGNYIDIVRTVPHAIKRITHWYYEFGIVCDRDRHASTSCPTLGPSPTVQWHPNKHVIAYCGQSKVRDGGPPTSAWISLLALVHLDILPILMTA